MPSPPPFPIKADELSTEFLTQALGLEVAEFTIERIGADRGMLGEIFLLGLALDSKDRSDHPRQLVAKFAALRDGSLASALRGRNYERELLCYEQLLDGTPVRVPALHGTWYDPATAHFLLLQEAMAADTTTDQVAGLTVEQAKTVLSEVAALHSQWWHHELLPELDWLPRLDGELRIDNLTTLARIGWPQLVAMLGDELPAVDERFGDELPDRIESALRSIAALPHTLLHCDLRADNLLFDPENGAVAIVDWQGCGVGPAAFDVAYFLVQSLSIADRRAHETELIDYWIAALTTHGVDATNAAAGYGESLWYGMAIACALPVISDPDEPRVRALARTVVTRTVAALTDHGQLVAPTQESP